ncbi:MAG: uroporphyrinogen decarboxylase family protein, partial [Candidatus Rokuibacteriota bacterium]
AEVLTEEESATWGLPYARQVLESVRHRASLVLLHIHGRNIFFDQVAALPVHAVNWPDRLTAPTLREAQDRFTGAVAGGLNEGTTLREGPPAAVADQVRDAIGQTDGLGLIVAAGCGLPLDVPDEHLRVVVETVRAPAGRSGLR